MKELHIIWTCYSKISKFLEREGTVDWLLGYGGIIPLYIDVYKKTKDNQYLEIAIFWVTNW